MLITQLVQINYIYVYENEIEEWRKQLKIGNEEKLFAAFACYHDEELCAARMFPKFLGYNTKFGVAKELRYLFLVAGVDVSKKVSTLFCCFMTSMEARSYHWICE